MFQLSKATASSNTSAQSAIISMRLRVANLPKTWWLAAFVLVCTWLMFFNELRGEWAVNAQYNYGYVVPLLGFALIWLRWSDKPEAVSVSSGIFDFVAIFFALLILPLRITLEANPEWRLLYWMHGILMLVLSLWFFHRSGGWPWVRYFSFPLAFMLIAIPWPMNFEQWIIQNLMRLVAALTVEVAGWLGIPAVQHGKLIEVGVGIVGIDEACSGVRSVQSALMLSLFLGEMRRFLAWRRIVLIGASLGFVLVANLVRTVFLTWTAANHGLHQMEAVHDTAGVIVMLIVLPSLMGLALLMKSDATAQQTVPSRAAFLGTRIPLWITISFIAWIATSELATAAWYRTHETNLISNVRWSVAWPEQSRYFKKTPLPEKSLSILRCSNSDSASWQDEEGNQWKAFFLRWEPGKNSLQLAKGHRPDICFPAAGAKLMEDLGQIVVDLNGCKIPFRHQTFESNGHVFHAFYCLWADRLSRQEKSLLENGSKESRLDAVLEGKRHLGQQVLEVVLIGPEDSSVAVELFQRRLPELIRMP